ncbi:MAG: MFS transporter [Bacillota bacterium]|nr:MFS transporter [Bacillota bacterium]
MATLAEKSSEKSTLNSYRWVILTLMVASFLLTFISRMAWPPLIPVVAPALRMTNVQAGALMTAFYFGYIITQIPAGVLTDRLGVKAILTISLVLEGIATFAMRYMTNYDTGFWLRVIVGLGAGAVMSACTRAVTEWFPPEERGTAFGILLAAPSAGIVLSNYIAPALNSALGWRGVFEVIGAFTTIIGILILFLVRTTSDQTPKSGNPLGGFKVIFQSKELILISLIGFCLLWSELGIATWANTYIKTKLGYSVATAGLVMIFYGIGGVVAPLLSGVISDKIGKRKSILIFAYAAQIPATIIFGYMHSIGLLYLMGFLVGFLSYLANPHLSILVTQFAGKEWAATATGTTNFVWQLASMLGPIVLGWSIDATGSFSSVWYILSAGPLLGIFLLMAINEKVRRV